MNKFVKCVSVFFLWLATISVSAHLFIPHDHHLTDTLPNQDKNCPASNQSSDNHSGLPIHCLAFNDFTSEKNRPLQLIDNLHISFDILNVLNNTTSSFISGSFITLKEFSKPFFGTSVRRSTSLRAPPALT